VQRIGDIKINKNIHLTFITPEGRSTFALDNAKNFPYWWLLQCAKLINRKEDFFVVLHKREFTPMKAENGLPIKKISSCFLQGEHVIPMSADEARKAFHTDAKTGKPLPRMIDHVFVDFKF